MLRKTTKKTKILRTTRNIYGIHYAKQIIITV